jgi:hypothetical protein
VRRRALVVAALGCCAATGASSPVQTLAGRYSSHFQNGLVDGTSYWSDDVVEIVPVSDDAAYVRAELQFYNGHSCSIAGVAKAQGDALVYRAPVPPDPDDHCVLSVRRKGASLLLDDGDNSCKSYCGARGSLGDQTLPWKSKRPITYMARLKNSSTSRDALTEWRTGKPVNP